MITTRSAWLRRIGAGMAWVLLTASAWAQAEPTVRIGDHAGYVRVVYDFGAVVGYTTSEADGVLQVVFARDASVPDGPPAPRNVLSALGGRGEARLELAPGARWRSQTLGTRIVIDVFDAPRTAPPRPRPASPSVRPATAQAASRPTMASPVLTAATMPVQREELSAPSPPPPAQPLQSPQPAQALPPPLLQPPVELHPEPEAERRAPGGSMASVVDGVLTVPFGPDVGAAAFRWNNTAFLVFDDRRAIDLSLLRDDGTWSAAVVQLLPEATLIRLPWTGGALTLSRVESGWAIAPAERTAEAPGPVLANDGLLLPDAAPGRVVVAPVDHGRRLLVGTWRDSPGAVTQARRTPDFAVVPTWQGAAVDPVSDEVAMTVRPDGFVIRAGGAALDPAIVSAVDPSASHLLDLPTGAPDALLRRLQTQVAGAAQAGPQARTPRRLAAAQTMVALGFGPETQSLLQAASTEDPEAAGSDAVIGLNAVAAILAGRPSEAAALDDRRFAASGEASVWRALRDGAARPQEAAPVLAAQLRLLQGYPDLLRRRVLPMAAEILANGGQPAAADELLAANSSDPSFDLARATRQTQANDPAASSTLEHLASGADRRQRARAIAMLAELRLSRGEIAADAAAEAMEKAAAAWRGDEQELAMRLRAAELREQAGAWRLALETLRDTQALFPEAIDRIRSRMARVFMTMLSKEHPVRPIDLVSLAGEFPDVLPSGPAGASLAGTLADALASLDLPNRAGPALESLMNAASGAARAELGARLATLQLENGNPAAALKTLTGSAAQPQSQWPARLAEQRALLHARARSATDLGGAVAELTALQTWSGDDARAALLEAAGDWLGARAALTDLLSRTAVSDAPPVVLRLATALARLDDVAGRRALREQWAGKLPPGPQQDVFRVLTAEPIRAITDLSRSAQEVRLARSLP